MSSAEAERNAAAELPNGDVVALLLEQHARIRGLFAEIAVADADGRKRAFDDLRALLAVHEAAEELIVRPVAAKTAGKQEAQDRNEEEREAARILKQLEGMDVASPEFLRTIAEFEQAIGTHADHEEQEEFPALVAQCTVLQRRTMGDRLRKAEHLAPTHPHPAVAGKPAALKMAGPFASMVDRARDVIGR